MESSRMFERCGCVRRSSCAAVVAARLHTYALSSPLPHLLLTIESIKCTTLNIWKRDRVQASWRLCLSIQTERANPELESRAFTVLLSLLLLLLLYYSSS